ncbi:MAG TPA: hypothetical protein VKC66_23415 [Xanthobacteraceae bacterium]|nr:hypothetical protein [Xanthobacteraceae bacterium]
MRPVQEFFDTNSFGAAFTGAAATATSYVAGATGWGLIIVPLLVIAVYEFCFRPDGGGSSVNRTLGDR